MSADDIMPSDAQVQAAAEGRATHPGEPHGGGTAGRLNWLRAGVLGANDGIVSVAGIVIGVAGATSARGPIFTAGPGRCPQRPPGGSDVRRAVLRVVIGGALGLAFTYGIGHLFGTAIG
jgi:VIT1/CCC1 family predicted Fe2+/Mn2+ transporter